MPKKCKVGGSICISICILGSYEGYVIILDLNKFDELPLKVPIKLVLVHTKLVLVNESSFGNKKSKVKIIWGILSISIKCNRMKYELAIRTYMDRTYKGVSKTK